MASIMGMTPSAFSPSSRFRFIQYVPLLEREGWQVAHRPTRPDRMSRSPIGGRIAAGLHSHAGRMLVKVNRLRDIRESAAYDVVFVNKAVVGGDDLSFERRLLARNPRVVFDFDDAIFLGRSEARVRWICEHAAWVTPGNEYLADFVRQHTSRVSVLPTVVDMDQYRPKDWRGVDPDAPVRVGWSGSDSSIGATLFPYLEQIAEAQRKLGFEFVIVTNTKPVLPVRDLRWTFVPWTEESEGELGDMFDVGIMPLVDNTFQRGKCGLKLLQYMAAALPTIASPVGVNAEIVQPGRTGFLASTREEWDGALAALVESLPLRRELGTAGWRRCRESYSTERWLPDLIDIFERVKDGAAARVPTLSGSRT
jgi:glycosyltransferase involved in cell wall biosynthesis